MKLEETHLLIGYKPATPEAAPLWYVRHGFVGPEKAPYALEAPKRPWELRILHRSEDLAAPADESVLWALRAAVRNARRRKYKNYFSGFSAYEQWMVELEDKDFEGEQLANAWCYDNLIDARLCAAKFLRAVSELCSKEPAAHLKSAADAYACLAEELSNEGETVVAPYPWMKDIPWTMDRRKAQAFRLRQGLVYERAAISEIERALKIFDKFKG